MPYNDSLKTRPLSDRFMVFCQQVVKIEETPDLINFVASESFYVKFCRDIIGSDKDYQTRFVSFCRQNQLNWEKIRSRLSVVATVLGIGKIVNYYEVLGVAPDADDKTIRQAYRKKAPYFHPDTVDGEKLKSDKFVELHSAFVHLTDPVLRENYDQLLSGKGDWVENSGEDWALGSRRETIEEEGLNALQAEGKQPGLGRFLGGLCVLLGIMFCIVFVVDIFQKRSSSNLSKRSDESLLEESNNRFQANLDNIAESRNKTEKVHQKSKKSTQSIDYTSPDTDQSAADTGQAPTLSDGEGAFMFYNPRREKRYWAAEDSRHDSYEGAIESLAKTYKTSPDWVARHMGPVNELAAIHQNLIKQQALEAEIKAETEMSSEVALQARAPELDLRDSSGLGPGTQPDLEPPPQTAPSPEKKKISEPESQDTGRIEIKTEMVSDPAPQATPPPAKQKIPTRKKTPAIAKPAATPAPKKVIAAVPPETKRLDAKGDDEKVKTMDRQRLVEFLARYTATYERKDLIQFEKYFTNDAQEMGKPFKTLLPVYQKTFDRVEALKYQINLKTFSIDKVANTIKLSGDFSAMYRLAEKDWSTRSGSLRMELLDAADGLLVKRLEYEMDK